MTFFNIKGGAPVRIVIGGVGYSGVLIDAHPLGTGAVSLAMRLTPDAPLPNEAQGDAAAAAAAPPWRR